MHACSQVLRLLRLLGASADLLGVLLQRFFDFKAKRLEVDLVRLNHENAVALRTIELQAQERIAARTAEADELIAQTEAQAREAEAAEQPRATERRR